jgi:hypothetical protein
VESQNKRGPDVKPILPKAPRASQALRADTTLAGIRIYARKLPKKVAMESITEKKSEAGVCRLILLFGMASLLAGAVLYFEPRAPSGVLRLKAVDSRTFGSDERLAPRNTLQSLVNLLALPMNELEKLDVGLINLLCAEDLPGSEKLNVGKCLSALDEWAQRVEFETRRHHYRFAEHPELFCNSLGYLRMQMLGDVLVHDLRMRYHPQRLNESDRGLNNRDDEDRFFANSKDIFIHGLLDGDRYGTCASMPFLYIAIGRRLGYPVNLAATEEHLYVRYEEPDGNHINIEATAISHFKTPPDEYYRQMCHQPLAETIESAGEV